MISFATDGCTLIDGDGKRVDVFSQPRYSELLNILDTQNAAKAENAHALDLYSTALANAQISVTAGRGADAPVKPMCHVVTDAGVSSYVPFIPVLADLVHDTITPSGGLFTPTADPNATMRSEIHLIFRKLFGL